jgi:CubicO group peptidase (beta-lactamase class C family)
VVQNHDSILPLKRLDKETTAILIAGASRVNNFLRTLRLYEDNDVFFLDKNGTGQSALFDRLKMYSRVIVGVHNTHSGVVRGYGISPNIAAFVDRLTAATDVILCVFAPPYALSAFANKTAMSAIVISYQETPIVQDYTAQLLYGAISGKGTLPVSVDTTYRYRHGIYTSGGLRLKYSIPEEVRVNAQALLPIDTMVQNAIRDSVMPGCQILAARGGVVFFRKEYGTTRYDRPSETVDPRHIYDLASVSKIAATLPSVMLLHDREQIELHDHLVEYLPELKGSDKERITMIDLLTHQARLQPFIAFYLRTMEPVDSTQHLLADAASPLHSIRLGPRAYLNRQRRFKNGYYTTTADSKHRMPVAADMHLLNTYRDTMLNGIRDSKLLARKRYVYSDLGFMLLAEVVERISKTPLDVFAEQQLYSRLGAATLGYHPTWRFPQRRIVPTSNDTIFRRQWLQGYVHDENAALMGGVSGHAGVFGTAGDLAKLMQMYLNGGTYGGERYIDEKTLAEFTLSPFDRRGNRRGIGFDKPELSPSPTDLMGKYASKKSFGHTGFTGTMVWMDPENDLLYVFLSNRVCPDASNNKLNALSLRSKIYEALVKAVQ